MNIARNSIGTFDVNHLTGVRHWSPKMRQLFGLKDDDTLEYSRLVEALHPDDREALTAAVAESQKPNGPEHFSLEYRVRWPDGSVHWLFVMARTQKSEDPDHHPLCTIGIATDITREKEAELIEEATYG